VVESGRCSEHGVSVAHVLFSLASLTVATRQGIGMVGCWRSAPSLARPGWGSTRSQSARLYNRRIDLAIAFHFADTQDRKCLWPSIAWPSSPDCRTHRQLLRSDPIIYSKVSRDEWHTVAWFYDSQSSVFT
jgi:hypothetical protein